MDVHTDVCNHFKTFPRIFRVVEALWSAKTAQLLQEPAAGGCFLLAARFHLRPDVYGICYAQGESIASDCAADGAPWTKKIAKMLKEVLSTQERPKRPCQYGRPTAGAITARKLSAIRCSVFVTKDTYAG